MDKTKRWAEKWKDTKDWKDQPPTQKQLDLLERLGCDWGIDDKPETRGYASTLIDEMLQEDVEFADEGFSEWWRDD